MNRKHSLVGIGNALNDLADHFAKLVGDGVPHCVRNIDGSRARINGRFDNPAEEIYFRTACILAGKLHIRAQISSPLDRANCLLDNLVRLQAQLVLHVNRTGGNERMNTAAIGACECFRRAVNVSIHRPREATDGAVLDGIGDQLDGGKIARASDGEACFNNIDSELFQRFGDA